MTIQYVQGSAIHSPTNCPRSYHISTFIRLDNAVWFHSVAIEIAVSTKEKEKKKEAVWGKCGVYHICPDACCVRTWILCFSLHKLKPFIKLVMMDLGLCCQPSKWSVTESVSEPWTCTYFSKTMFITSVCVFLLFLKGLYKLLCVCVLRIYLFFRNVNVAKTEKQHSFLSFQESCPCSDMGVLILFCSISWRCLLTAAAFPNKITMTILHCIVFSSQHFDLSCNVKMTLNHA